MKLSKDDTNKLKRLLEEVSRAVEELLLTGLTTASNATRQTLEVSFREASRMRLLRLGSTLRACVEELGRYAEQNVRFSAKRLTFFLNRAWMIARGLLRAVEKDDQAQLNRLLWTPDNASIKNLELVTVGVAKKEVENTYCAFEFRLRSLKKAGKLIEKHHRLIWSCIFPLKPGNEIPAEGFLHLPHKQKFKANDFLLGKILHVTDCLVSVDAFGGGRISLTDKSTVTTGEPFSDWKAILRWDRQAAATRLREHDTSPFDLEVEMQEEVVLEQWSLGEEAKEDREDQRVFPLSSGDLTFDAVVSKSSEGKTLGKKLSSYRKKKDRPPIFGLMHYEMCRLLFQPLTAFENEAPLHLMISDEKIDRSALLRSLNFG
ncbi:MAG: hypothetical protein AAF802_10700 [Planctomycetota bacterium]